METIKERQTAKDRSWEKIVMKYAHPDLRKSIWQLCNSIIPYLLIWFLMYRSLQYSYWVTLLLALPACGFLIRIFIIFHDCGHGSFFKSKRANDVVGMICGILAFTPYHKWHQQHRMHHATAGNLDKRGMGDVWTLTVDEYLQSPKSKRFIYRVVRNPFILFIFGPIFVVFVQNRLSKKSMTGNERRNVYFTNIVLGLTAIGMIMLIGFKAYLLIQLPIILISHSIGLWLFYIQHQYDDVVWDRAVNWDYKTTALTGCSFLKLPVILQWFTGNIGFHHVHHLSSKIPNYKLAQCHYENDLFKDVKPVLLFSTFKALRLSLWDEANRKMIRFRKIAVPV